MSKGTKRELRLFLLGFGVFIGLCGWSMFSQGKKSVYEIDKWARVEALILESRTDTVSMNNPSSSGPSSVTGWKPMITYSYRFGGERYECSRYTAVSSESLDRDKVNTIVNSHPKGGKAMAYVNPDDPSEAVLSRSDRKPSMVHLVVGVLLCVIGIACGVAASLLRSRQATTGRF